MQPEKQTTNNKFCKQSQLWKNDSKEIFLQSLQLPTIQSDIHSLLSQTFGSVGRNEIDSFCTDDDLINILEKAAEFSLKRKKIFKTKQNKKWKDVTVSSFKKI